MMAIGTVDSEQVVGENCENCGEFVEGFEYKHCCDGYMCGCRGMPIEPCVCSKECFNEKYNANDSSKGDGESRPH